MATLAAVILAGTPDARAGTTYTTNTVTTIGDRLTEPAGGLSLENAVVTVNSGVVVSGAGAGVRGNLNLNPFAVDASFHNNGLVISTVPSVDGVNVEGYAPLGIPVGNATYVGGVNSGVVGAENGIKARGVNAYVTIHGGSVIGNNGDGLLIAAVGDPLMGGEAKVTLGPGTDEIRGTVDAIDVLSTGIGTDARNVIDVQGGTVTGDTDDDGDGDGIVATALAGGLVVPRAASNEITTAGDVTGANGITAVAMSANGHASNTIVANGDVTGTYGEGIVAVSASADVEGLDDLDDVELPDLMDLGSLDPDALDDLPVGAGTANVSITATGNVTGAGNGITALAMGQSGVVDIDTSAGSVTGQDGFGVIGAAIGPGGSVDITTGNVSGALGGVLGLNTSGDTNVTVNGLVTVESGGLIGVGAIAAGGGDATVDFTGIIDPPIIGAGALTLGSGTATVNTAGLIDADVIGVIALNIGTGHAAVNNSADVFSSSGATPILGVGGGKIGNNSATGAQDVIVSNSGDISDFAIGMGGLAIGDGNDVLVQNSGTIEDGYVGVAGAVIGNGAGGSLVISNTGTIQNNLAVGVIGLGIGDDHTVSVGNAGTVDAAYVGVAGGIIGNDGALNVASTGPVTADYVGVAGLVIGNGNSLGISASNATGTAGVGVVGALIGDGNSGAISTTGSIAGAYLGVGALAIGDGNQLSIDASGTATGQYLGVGGLAIGDNNRLSVAAGAASGAEGLGVLGLSIGNDSVLDVTTQGAVTGRYAGVGALQIGNRATINIVTNGPVTSTDGVGVAGAAIGTYTALNITTGDVAAPLVGVAAASVGNGFANIDVNGAVKADGLGVLAAKLGDGDVSVNVDGSIAGLTSTGTDFAGVFVFNSFGNGLASVSTGASASIVSDLDAIAILKQDSDSFDGTAINVSSYGSLTAGEHGIDVQHVDGDGTVNVVTYGTINAGHAGIYLVKDHGAGDVNIVAGGIINAEDGVLAYGDGQDGDLNVSTGAGGTINASDAGIVAGKDLGGSGSVVVSTGALSVVSAGDTGIDAYSLLGGGGNDVSVSTGQFSTVTAGVDAIYVESWDNATVSVGDGATVRGDVNAAGLGNAIHIVNADLATVNVGAGAFVFSTAQGWADAVISVTSDDGATINVGSGALVSAWSYNGTTQLDLADAASRVVIDVDGAAGMINNYGTIVGLVGLTDFADTFNNLSSDTWITVGDNNFGAGTDMVNNTGVIVTAVQAGVAEQTSFLSLESFVNGNPAGTSGGVLSSIDETPGTLGRTATRDVTYVSGIFTSVGNSAVGLDTYLGGPGSTSDQLVIGGLDASGAPFTGTTLSGTTYLLIHDVNPGAAAYNIEGIQLVEVENGSAAGAGFALDPRSSYYSPRFGGVLDKGLFIYDLVTEVNADGQPEVRLVSAPDEEVFEFPSFISAAQQIWYETSGVWLDRQADLRAYVVDPALSRGPGGTPAEVTPGIWGKVIGNWATRDESVTHVGRAGTYQYDTGYSQDTYGLIAGVDFGKTSGDTTWIFGVLGGYLSSSVDMEKSLNSGSFTGGTVGAYATYLNGGFFVDALFKADILTFDYDAIGLYLDINKQASDVNSLGFTIDTGYRFNWTETLFVEPVATLSYVQTNIDDIWLPPSASVDFHDGESLRASVGARVGGRVHETENYVFEGSVTGRFWYEFKGDNYATFTSPGIEVVANDSLQGAFGEVGAALNWFGKESGWNGFVNANIKFNGDYTSGTANAGIRYQF
jgi:outer membrane autotransporter protein